MFIFILFLIVIGFIISLPIQQLLPISLSLHELCLAQAPLSPWREFYQAIVCGAPLKSSLHQSYLKDLGLLHIIVVSGSHLTFLSQWAHTFINKKWKGLHLIILFIFVLMTRMEAPILRAFVLLMLIQSTNKAKLFYGNYFLIFSSTIFCLSLNPHWFFSQSLLLSWGASLGIQMGRNFFTKSLLCYLVISPLITSFSLYSPFSILINSTITPLISTLLFPVSVIAFFIPTSFLSDKLWMWLFYICDLLSFSENTHYFALRSGFPLYTQWFYLLTINMVCIHLQRKGL